MFVNGKDSEYNINLKGKYIRSAEHRLNLKLRNVSQKRAVVTPMGQFIGTLEATKAHGYKDKNSVINNCYSKNPKYADWYYVDTGPVEVDPNWPDWTEERTKTMLKKYGKKALVKAQYTYDGLSQMDYMKANKKLMYKLVDDNHRYKYHKIHQMLIEKCDEKQASQNRRSVCICRFFEETA